MSDNSGVLVGYWLSATITAEHIEDACAALGYEISSEATGEEPADMLMRILMAMGQPVVFTGNASDHGIKITTNESREQRIWQLVFRDEMEAKAARVAVEKDAEIARLRAALSQVKDALAYEINEHSIVCTVWISPIETMADFIDAALNEGAAS